MSSSAPLRLVLADDHALFRSGLRSLLERTRTLAVVAEASSGREALEAVAQHAPDGLVLDVHMKDMLGTAVMQQLREQDVRVRVLVLSAHADVPYVEQMARAGANGYVTKDRSPLDIAEAVRRVVQGEEVWLVPQPLASPLLALHERERRVLVLLAQGLSNDAIAAEAGMAENTVRNYLTVIYEKLGVEGAREAIAWAWRNRVMEP
ncbi:MAG: response regulator transcription factor [Rhodothermales bacterium]|mgnify:CR=1 FL=1|nr:response regulator transcription factor [Rhodothermales bacterium]